MTGLLKITFPNLSWYWERSRLGSQKEDWGWLARASWRETGCKRSGTAKVMSSPLLILVLHTCTSTWLLERKVASQMGHRRYLLHIHCSNPGKRPWSVSVAWEWPQPQKGLHEASIANFLIHFTKAFPEFLGASKLLFLLIKKGTTDHFFFF